VLAALSLALWVTGVGCGFVCGGGAMAAIDNQVAGHNFTPQDSSLAVASEVHSTSAHHACCAKHHGVTTPGHSKTYAHSSAILLPGYRELLAEIASLTAPDGPSNTCQFTINATALRTKAGESISIEALPPAALLVSDLNHTPLPLLTPGLLNNGSHTYLRCCVFLI
jgi:hypothetical protein